MSLCSVNLIIVVNLVNLYLKSTFISAQHQNQSAAEQNQIPGLELQPDSMGVNLSLIHQTNPEQNQHSSLFFSVNLVFLLCLSWFWSSSDWVLFI